MGFRDWVSRQYNTVTTTVSDGYYVARAAVQPSYVPPVYQAPAAPTAEERKIQTAKANAFNDSFQTAAANTETGLVTTAQVSGAIGGALIGGRVPFIGPVGGGMLGWEGTEMLFDAGLQAKGGPPARSLTKLYSPIPEDCGPFNPLLDVTEAFGVPIRQDKIYAAGVTPLDYKNARINELVELLKNKPLRILSADGSGKVLVSDLDRDKDGKLSAADIDAIKKIFPDKDAAQGFLDMLRDQYNITFENQSVKQVEETAKAAGAEPVVASITFPASGTTGTGTPGITATGTVTVTNPASGATANTGLGQKGEKGFFGKIIEWISHVFQNIVNLFTGSSKKPVAAPPQASSAPSPADAVTVNVPNVPNDISRVNVKGQ